MISVFEGVGSHSAGKMSKEDLVRLTECACPGYGSCAGMFTANSMNCLGEVLGFALPGNGTIPATTKVEDEIRQFKLNPERLGLVKDAAKTIVSLMEQKVRPLDILTEKGFAVVDDPTAHVDMNVTVLYLFNTFPIFNNGF